MESIIEVINFSEGTVEIPARQKAPQDYGSKAEQEMSVRCTENGKYVEYKGIIYQVAETGDNFKNYNIDNVLCLDKDAKPANVYCSLIDKYGNISEGNLQNGVKDDKFKDILIQKKIDTNYNNNLNVQDAIDKNKKETPKKRNKISKNKLATLDNHHKTHLDADVSVDTLTNIPNPTKIEKNHERQSNNCTSRFSANKYGKIEMF